MVELDVQTTKGACSRRLLPDLDRLLSKRDSWFGEHMHVLRSVVPQIPRLVDHLHPTAVAEVSTDKTRTDFWDVEYVEGDLQADQVM